MLRTRGRQILKRSIDRYPGASDTLGVNQLMRQDASEKLDANSLRVDRSYESLMKNGKGLQIRIETNRRSDGADGLCFS